MNAKVVILLVIAIAAIGGGVYFFMWTSSNSTDYTLFDSDDNIKEGLTIDIEMKDHGSKSSLKTVVDSVKDGKVNSTIKTSIDGLALKEYTMDNFHDTFIKEFGFDFADGGHPEDVEIEHDGDTFKITGSTVYNHEKYTFNLRIVYINDKVTSVEGTFDAEPDYADMKDTVTFSTVLGTLKATFSEKGTVNDEIALNKFFNGISPFDPDDFPDAEVTDGKLGNVNVKIYTVDGTYGSIDYIDVNMYVYNGHLLKQEGKIVDDGKEYETYLLLKIRQA